MEPNDFLLSSPKKIFFYGIKPYRFRVFCMYTSVIAGFVCGYSLPYFLKVIADKISTTHQIAYSLSDFYTPLFCIFLILVGQELFFRIGHILETFITVRVFDRVTTKIYKTLINRPTAFFEQTFSGELNRYLEQIGSGVKFFIDFFPWEIGWIVVAPLVTIVLLAQANMWLVLVFIVWFLLFVLVSFFSLRWIYRQSKNISESYGELSGAVVDVFANTSIVHGFAAYDYEYMRYRGYMDAVISAERRERKIEIFNKFQQGISVLLLVLSLVTTGIFLFIKNLITVGDFLIIAAIIPTFIDIVRSGGDVVIKAVHNYADFKNAIAGLNIQVSYIQEGDGDTYISTPTIEFKNISFSYSDSDKKVLADFSLFIHSGQKVGLVGKSGAGKSTIIKLLLRSYDCNSGTIYMGDKDISKLTFSALRNHISFIPQDTTLFNRTLFENILYGKPDAAKEQVYEASMCAHADEFIKSYPKGYETLVGEKGIKLSGGQRQRISIARAMLRNAPVLILDEATSALDGETEEIVQKGLYELFADKTVLAVAHRLSTLRAMDRIIVLDEGKIVEDGSPQDLLSRDHGIFKVLWEHQKNGFV